MNSGGGAKALYSELSGGRKDLPFLASKTQHLEQFLKLHQGVNRIQSFGMYGSVVLEQLWSVRHTDRGIATLFRLGRF